MVITFPTRSPDSGGVHGQPAQDWGTAGAGPAQAETDLLQGQVAPSPGRSGLGTGWDVTKFLLPGHHN